jgi:small GTP-binding protein
LLPKKVAIGIELNGSENAIACLKNSMNAQGLLLGGLLKGPIPFKVVLLGTVGVGKTSLLHRFNTDSFDPDLYHTIGETFLKKVVKVGFDEVVMHLWDTAGQERFASETTLAARDAHCCIVCYDVHDPSTYQFIAPLIHRYCSTCVIHEHFVVVVGNKSDLATSDEQALELERLAKAQQTDERWVQSFLTSARNGDSVKELFQFVAQQLHEHSAREPVQHERVEWKGSERKSDRGCC